MDQIEICIIIQDNAIREMEGRLKRLQRQRVMLEEDIQFLTEHIKQQQARLDDYRRHYLERAYHGQD
jgi:hypothetical protein